MTNLAVAALIRKRAELAGEIAVAEIRLGQARADLLHLDAVIRLFNPSFKPEAIPPKEPRRQDGWFSEGELPRTVLDILRTVPEPLNVREIAVVVMERRGLDTGDRATLATVERRVHRALSRRRSMVERVSLGPRAVGWRIAP